MATAADQLWSVEITVPAGTAVSDPQVTTLGLPRNLAPGEFEITVPPGPNGTVGFALAVGSTPILPRNPGGWVIANDRTIVWPIPDRYLSGGWSLTAYNTGAYDHTLYVQARMVDPTTFTTVPAGDLSAISGLTGGA